MRFGWVISCVLGAQAALAAPDEVGARCRLEAPVVDVGSGVEVSAALAGTAFERIPNAATMLEQLRKSPVQVGVFDVDDALYFFRKTGARVRVTHLPMTLPPPPANPLIYIDPAAGAVANVQVTMSAPRCSEPPCADEREDSIHTFGIDTAGRLRFVDRIRPDGSPDDHPEFSAAGDLALYEHRGQTMWIDFRGDRCGPLDPLTAREPIGRALQDAGCARSMDVRHFMGALQTLKPNGWPRMLRAGYLNRIGQFTGARKLCAALDPNQSSEADRTNAQRMCDGIQDPVPDQRRWRCAQRQQVERLIQLASRAPRRTKTVSPRTSKRRAKPIRRRRKTAR